MPVTKRRTTTKKPRVLAELILFGIETEFTRPNHGESNSSADINATAQAAVEKFHKGDLSEELDATGRDGGGIEVISEPHNFEWWSKNGLKLYAFTQALKDLKFVADNNLAGIHVHVDRSIFVYDQFKEFLKFLSTYQKFLSYISRRKERARYFCNLNTTSGKTGNPASEFTKEIYERNNTYLGNNTITLNNHGKYGTIECRFFNGSLEPTEIMLALEFVRSVCYFIKSRREKTLLAYVGYIKDYGKKYPNLLSWMEKESLISKGVVKETKVASFTTE